jgi:hypothetical protein
MGAGAYGVEFDQTDPAWLRNTNDRTEGTGVYLSPKGTGLYVHFHSGITRGECLAEGASFNALALKWVPTTIAHFAQVTSSTCNSSGQACVDRCPGFACFCLHGKCAP